MGYSKCDIEKVNSSSIGKNKGDYFRFECVIYYIILLYNFITCFIPGYVSVGFYNVYCSKPVLPRTIEIIFLLIAIKQKNTHVCQNSSAHVYTRFTCILNPAIHVKLNQTPHQTPHLTSSLQLLIKSELQSNINRTFII